KHFAVGGFDSTCYALTEAILRAAEESNTPLLLMVPPFAFGRSYDDAYTRHMVQRCKEVTVPVALHLDHATHIEDIRRAIVSGFSSVMIDASFLPFDQNVKLTKAVVAMAHDCGVSVEAEIGNVGGGEASLTASTADSNYYTKPEEAVAFAESTNIDSLAIAFGTIHGPYSGTPKLDFELLRTIRQMLPQLPLVMHGGSGLHDDDFQAAVVAGINKVNIFTEISTLYTASLAKAIVASGSTAHLHQVITPAEDSVVEAIKHYMYLFGTPKANAL
ncbi:MAG: class II fructose-bisphosphate aldolase, partial [Acinetobacter sp.]